MTWVRTIEEFYVPCDEEPILYAKDNGKLKIIKRRDLIDGCSRYDPNKHTCKPLYGLLPHYYSCPVLRDERRAWARGNSRQEATAK